MNFKPNRWCAQILIVLLVAAFLPVGAADPPAPAPKVRKKILRQIDRCLRKKAFVHGKDFSDASAVLTDDLPQIEAAETTRTFTLAVNEGLADYEVSHLRLASPGQMEARRNGKAVGAGIKVVPVENGHLVTLVLPGSPADKAGMLKGDVVVAVNGTRVDDGERVPGLLVRGLSGEIDETRNVEWLRGDRELSAEIGFGEFAMALPFTLEWMDEDVAWVTLNTFRDRVYERAWVESTFREIALRRAEGVVLDLRSNGGGRLSNTFHLMSMFLPEGTYLGARISKNAIGQPGYDSTAESPSPEAGARSVLQRYATHIPIYRGPLIVLIDGSSGSGGDYFPASMQDLRDATLIGSKTIGALLGGSWCNLAHEFALLYPSQEILRPDGSRVEGVGVSPDIVLTPQETSDDRYIVEVALKTMRELRAATVE